MAEAQDVSTEYQSIVLIVTHTACFVAAGVPFLIAAYERGLGLLLLLHFSMECDNVMALASLGNPPPLSAKALRQPPQYSLQVASTHKIVYNQRPLSPIASQICWQTPMCISAREYMNDSL